MSQHDTLTLEPCPFCGAQPEQCDVGDHVVTCPSCGVDGPYGAPSGVAGAIQGWNRRAALSATQPAQVAQSTHWTEREPVRLAPSRVGRVYVAGPMTGIADFNFPAFNAETETLRAQGLSVLNPADHGIVAGANWADYLRHDIAGLASCERIHLLRGWSKSKGAQLEVTIAKALGMVITYQDGAEAAQAAQGAGEAVASIYITPDGSREMDDWKHDLPVGQNILYTQPAAGADVKPGRKVIEIVSDHLKSIGADGLVCPDAECACRLDELAPCDSVYSACQPGWISFPTDPTQDDWQMWSSKKLADEANAAIAASGRKS